MSAILALQPDYGAVKVDLLPLILAVVLAILLITAVNLVTNLSMMWAS
jgi:hypothetical protein